MIASYFCVIVSLVIICLGSSTYSEQGRLHTRLLMEIKFPLGIKLWPRCVGSGRWLDSRLSLIVLFCAGDPCLIASA